MRRMFADWAAETKWQQFWNAQSRLAARLRRVCTYLANASKRRRQVEMDQ
jgi:hypothetical protein